MPAFDIADLSALEILDSRGRPTLAVTVRLADGTTARAGVPSPPPHPTSTTACPGLER